MSFAFIEAHSDEFSLVRMCEILGVSSSGFCAWQHREPSQRDHDNRALVVSIREVYEHSRQTCGSPRVHAELKNNGQRVSRHCVARLMRLYGMRAKRKQRYKTPTQRPLILNLLPISLLKTLRNYQ